MRWNLCALLNSEKEKEKNVKLCVRLSLCALSINERERKNVKLCVRLNFCVHLIGEGEMINHRSRYPDALYKSEAKIIFSITYKTGQRRNHCPSLCAALRGFITVSYCNDEIKHLSSTYFLSFRNWIMFLNYFIYLLIVLVGTLNLISSTESVEEETHKFRWAGNDSCVQAVVPPRHLNTTLQVLIWSHQTGKYFIRSCNL